MEPVLAFISAGASVGARSRGAGIDPDRPLAGKSRLDYLRNIRQLGSTEIYDDNVTVIHETQPQRRARILSSWKRIYWSSVVYFIGFFFFFFWQE